MSQRAINLAVIGILGPTMAVGLVAAGTNTLAQLAVVGVGSLVGMDIWRSSK